MKLESFRAWIRQIYATRDDELTCNDVFELIPKYVDTEVAGDNPVERFPKVAHHLDQCSRCHDLYAGVLEAAELEEREQPETVAAPSVEA